MGMIDIGRQFDDCKMALLRSCIGHTLKSYEAYSPFGDEAHVYKHVRLHFDGFDLDVRNAFEQHALGPDYVDEQVAIMTLDLADERPIWHPAGKELVSLALEYFVNDVLVVMDTALLSRGSRSLTRLKLVQAVLFEDENGQLLVFDRDIWQDEYLSVRKGASISTTTRDFRDDWIAEPPYSYTFKRDIVRLSNPHA